MTMLVMILSIYVGSHANTVVIHQQLFDEHFHGDAEKQCNKIRVELEQAYGNQVISSKCIRGY